MRHRNASPTSLLLGLLALGLSSCLEGTTGPGGTDPPEIFLRVTGGLTGVDYALEMDGPQGEVIGVSCVSGCEFEDGDLLHGLNDEQVEYIADLFTEADVHGLNGSDFGNQCCDQFYYELEYVDGTGMSTVKGSSEALPQGLRDAAVVVAGFVAGIVPITLDPHGTFDDWEGGQARVISAEIQGDFLIAEVPLEVGCETHHIDLVAFGGWLESDPVQVRAVFHSDSSYDLCETPILSREVTIDLRPLKKAYQNAYGVSDPGTTTLALMIHGTGSSSLWWNRFDYTF